MSRHLLADDFPQLEERFVGHVRELRRRDSLAPIVVLVPANLLRLHLQRTLARARVNHLNVRFVTFADLVREATAMNDCKPSPPFAGELLVKQACEQLSADDFYFKELIHKPGLHRALAATITDLKQAGFSCDDFQRVASHVKWNELTHKKVHSLARVRERYEMLKVAANLIDDDDALQLAIDRARDLPLWRDALAFIVYGLYDFNQLQLQLLFACAQGRETTVYFPHIAERRAFVFAAEALQLLQKGEFEMERLPSERDTWVDRVFEEVASERNTHSAESPHPLTRVASDARSPAPPLQILSVPGETREAREIARTVVRLAQDESARGRRVGILLHDAAPYSRLLREVCAGVGLTPFGADGVPLADTPAGRSVLSLLRILESDYSRRAVMEFVTTTDLQSPQPTALWDALTIRAKIVKGRDEWTRGLRGLPSLLEDRNRRRDADERRIDPGEVEPLRKFIGKLFALLENVTRAKSWTKLVDAALATVREFIAECDDRRRVLDAVRELRRLEVIGLAPEARLFARLCDEALRKATTRGGASEPGCVGFEENQPTIARMAGVRGVPFEVVIVPGLVEKSFPQAPAVDSILLDHERRQLQRAADQLKVEVRLPLKSARAEEERLLFRLAVGAASERVVLMFPRIESENGRQRLPSSYLLHVMEAVTGERADYARLDAWQPYVERVRLSDLAPKEDAASSLDAVEYDLARALVAVDSAPTDPSSDAPRPQELVAYLQWPHFRNAARCEQMRWTTRKYTAFDGRIAGREPLELLRRVLRFDAPISASRLERWAKCPFKFFLQHALRLDPLDEPETLIKPSPLDQGNLLHDLLAQFFGQAKAENWLPADDDFPQRLLKFVEQRLDRFAATGVAGLGAVWQHEKEVILRQLQRFAKKEIEWQQKHRPEWFERRFGDEPQLVGLALPNGRTVSFTGRMDRVDLSPDQTSAHVTDYKSRTVPDASKPNFDGGEALQAGVYALAVVESLGKRIEGARYVPLAAEEYSKSSRPFGKPLIVEDWARTERQLAETVQLVIENAERGLFPQHPGSGAKKHCTFCDFRRLCMSMQEPLFEMKHRDEFASEFVALKGASE